jgi:predicted nuclease of predicted toxin-antitoxin system
LKLLVDENLPPRIVRDLADLFPESAHVHSIGLSSTADTKIWEYARANGSAFLTKDKDFANLSIAWGAPPKVILLQVGNCATTQIVQLMRKNAVRIVDFENDGRRSLLILR